MTRAGQISLPFDALTAAPNGFDSPAGRTQPPACEGTAGATGSAGIPVVFPTQSQSATTAITPPHTRLTAAGATLAPLYFVRHRRARRYLLRVEPDGRLRVTIPRGGSRREAEAFAVRNLIWIASQRARVTPPAIDAEQRKALRTRAGEELPVRLRELANEHGVTGMTRVSIRNQRTRWGSCGRDGHITLNWRLVLMPPAVRDYVLIHELMHLRRMDHSPAYWRLVAEACPDYDASRAWLRANGRTLR